MVDRPASSQVPSLGPQFLSRRSFLKLSAVAGIAVSTGSCGWLTGGGGTSVDQLSIQSWGGAYLDIVKNAATDPMRQNYPELTIDVTEESNSELFPRLAASMQDPPPPVDGGQWNDSWTARGAADDMWAELDLGNMPNASSIVDGLNPESGFGLTFGISPFGIAYNPEYVDAPTSWTDLYNPEYRGKVGLWDVFFDWLIMASRIEGGDEYDLEPGIRAWEAAKDNIAMWIPSLPLVHEALDRGEIWLAADWASWALQAKSTGLSVEFALPEEGATQASSILQVHAGVEDDTKALTEEFFNYYLTPEFQDQQTREAFYSPVVDGVEIPSDIDSPGLVTAQEAKENLIRYDYAHIGEQFDPISAMIDERLK